MKIVSSTGRDNLAIVYVAQTSRGDLIEFVESLQPPKTREEKWVLIVSTLMGCPVDCRICDAGTYYHGRVSKEGIYWQIDNMVTRRYPDRKIPSKQFKIQFARMGEPAFNMNVLEVIEEFDLYFDAPGFMPSISTIAPQSADNFFDELLRIKFEKYNKGNFQLQFSIHTTDMKLRNEIIPVKKWDFRKIGEYGAKFYSSGDRKITLNFAASNELPIEPEVMLEYFNPEKFLVKVTPLNPTYNSRRENLTSYITNAIAGESSDLVKKFRKCGYETVVSIGETDENLIGSNCGQNILTHAVNHEKHSYGYSEIDNELQTKLRERLGG
jgi:23S rRNA (adenine2503-C2)-methyltransferase